MSLLSAVVLLLAMALAVVAVPLLLAVLYSCRRSLLAAALFTVSPCRLFWPSLAVRTLGCLSCRLSCRTPGCLLQPPIRFGGE